MYFAYFNVKGTTRERKKRNAKGGDARVEKTKRKRERRENGKSASKGREGNKKVAVKKRRRKLPDAARST